MKPYYQDDAVTIYHGDCREILPALERVDLVLTDPPYGIGIANNPVRQKHAKSSWDDQPVADSLLLFAISLGDNAIVWGGNYFGLPPSQGFLVWDKIQPEALTLAMCEQAWMSEQRPAKMFRKSVLSYSKEHPTQKPLDLMTWCLSLYPDAQTILDPFAGSCTTGVAAKSIGLKCICIEREERYCEIGVNRLRQEYLDLGC